MEDFWAEFGQRPTGSRKVEQVSGGGRNLWKSGGYKYMWAWCTKDKDAPCALSGNQTADFLFFALSLFGRRRTGAAKRIEPTQVRRYTHINLVLLLPLTLLYFCTFVPFLLFIMCNFTDCWRSVLWLWLYVVFSLGVFRLHLVCTLTPRFARHKFIPRWMEFPYICPRGDSSACKRLHWLRNQTFAAYSSPDGAATGESANGRVSWCFGLRIFSPRSGAPHDSRRSPSAIFDCPSWHWLGACF